MLRVTSGTQCRELMLVLMWLCFQVWKGYHGNVYFQPIRVSSASIRNGEQVKKPLAPDITNFSDKLKDALKSSKRFNGTNNSPAAHRNARKQAARPAARGARSVPKDRMLAVLDKGTVYARKDGNFQQDVVWVSSQEATGSVCLPGAGAEAGDRADPETRLRRSALEREKICRGSVAHKLLTGQRAQTVPLLSVSGDRYVQPVLPSALMRTQTQYSQSSQRPLTTPEPFHGYSSHDRLPPLEQLRASLRHMDSSTISDPVPSVVNPMDRIPFEDQAALTKDKPFVKYSPEIRNSAQLGGRRLQQSYTADSRKLKA